MKTYLVISGIDGSGKTTVINALKYELEKQGYTTQYIWMRFNHYTVKVMNALARLFGLSVKVHNAFGDVWEHRLYKSRLFCKIYVLCSFIDNKLARRKATKLNADYIICDRWINDTLIDLGAECRIMDILDSRWYGRFQSILPQNALQFVVVRKDEDIINCRVENRTNPNFPYRLKLYGKLKDKPEVHVIDNTGTIRNSVSQVLEAIEYDKKSGKVGYNNRLTTVSQSSNNC